MCPAVLHIQIDEPFLPCYHAHLFLSPCSPYLISDRVRHLAIVDLVTVDHHQIVDHHCSY